MIQSGQNCTKATPTDEHQPDQRADIGNEADQPGEQADQDAEIQPRQRQPDRVDDAEHEAERALPAHEAGGRRVDVGGDLREPVSTWSRGTQLSTLATMRSQSSSM